MSRSHLIFFVQSFIVLLGIVDPLGTVVVYLNLVRGISGETRRKIVFKSGAVILALLTLFALVGNQVMRFIGISIEAVYIAGGIILFGIALDLLQARAIRYAAVEENPTEGSIWIIPLATPLIAGPGAMATVMVLATQCRSTGMLSILILAIFVNVAICYFTLRMATAVETLFKETGLKVVSRAIGFLLVIIAVQFVLNGIRIGFPGLMSVP